MPEGREHYRGRFAPSPTGSLHFGSLVAAVASYVDARHASGEWLVRIDDIDPPREVAGSTDDILRTLATFGFQWNESILRQSTRLDAYRAALERLVRDGHAYACSCSRAEIDAAQSGPRRQGEDALRSDGGIIPAEAGNRYPGWCRNGVREPSRATAVRFRTPDGVVTFDDRIQGHQVVDVAAEVGDFVIRRRDTLPAYQLACAVDDAAQGITHVVRGADLLESTPRQLLLHGALGLPRAKYAHVPVVTDAAHVKFSKSAGAAAIDSRRPVEALWRALHFLQQAPPTELITSDLATLWDWAIAHWQTNTLAGVRSGTAAEAPVDHATD